MQEPRTPWWFKILFAAGWIGSFGMLCLMAWVIFKLVPPLVGWLERH